MASFFSQEQIGAQSQPVIKPTSNAFGARLRGYRASLNWSAFSPALTTADDVFLGSVPAGATFSYGVIASNVSLGTTTLNIGLTKTHANNTQYATGLTHTGVNAPAIFGMVRDPGAGLGTAFTTLPYGVVAVWGTTEPAQLPQRDIYLTFGTAAPPATNTWTTITLFFLCP